MLEVKQIIEQTSYGATKPLIILANDNKKYILKFRNSSDYDNEKDLHIFNEYLAYKLIELYNFKISPQKLEFILIDDYTVALAEKACTNKFISYESLTFLKKSLGTNIAIEFLKNTEKANADDINVKSFRNQVKHIDNYILNNDRIKENTNVLKDLNASEKYYAIDYGLAMLDNRIYEAIIDGKIDTYRMSLQNCNITYCDRYIFNEKEFSFQKLGIQNLKDKIREIIETCPIEWEILNYKEEVIEIISSRLDSKVIFDETKCPMELY